MSLQVIPESKPVLVSPAHTKTERISNPPSGPAASVSSGDTADASRSKVSSVHVRVTASRPGRAERVTSRSDVEEGRKRQVCVLVCTIVVCACDTCSS